MLMKRNISGLLDSYPVEGLDLGITTPYSSSRIKELTMNKVSMNKPRKHVRPLRFLAVAAIISTLTVSALAVGHVLGAGALLQNFFAEKNGSLSDGQIQVIDQMGKTFENGVTSNGTTITPIAALADENVYYLRLQIKAPEDVILPDYDSKTDGCYQLFGPGEALELTFEDGAYSDSGYILKCDWLPDENPQDNLKEVVIWIGAQTGTDVRFNDEVSKQLTLHGLWLQTPEKEYTQILSGEFSFDITLYNDTEILSLDTAGLTWSDEEYGYTSTLENLTLSPLSLTFSYSATEPNNNRIVPYVGPLEVVLKDGSTVAISETAGMEGMEYYVFAAPLDLSQVDYVKYGNHQISLEAN